MAISRLLAAVALAGMAIGAAPAQARITRIEISHVEPAFGGQSFGAAGVFERATGRAYGEVDPAAAANAPIQDIGLAPRNASGMVEYSTDIDILRPADPAKGNKVLLFNVLNRGNKGAEDLFNADVTGSQADRNRLASPGDGWLQRQGYTLIWFGWQADVLPGDGRMTFSVPAARNADGSPLEGVVRSELVVRAAATTLNLSSGWFTGLTHNSYPTVSTDNRTPLADGFLPTLTVRGRENAPREPISSVDWRFGACSQSDAPDPKQICYPAGFQPGKLYELIYRARDPLVMGLGFAVARDLGAFLRSADHDDAGTANPVAHGPDIRTIVMGTSQSGRMIRSLIHLGFNEAGPNAPVPNARVFDGALPHIGGGLLPLSLRFAQPGRAWGQQVDHLYPAYDFPFTYARVQDPLTERSQGILDRCTVSSTCPRIFHAATALELWEGRQSLGLTDPLGRREVPEPPDVRTFIMVGTQHAPAGLPLPTSAPFGFNACVQQPNPNPHTWTMRALLAGLTAWVRDGTAPPDSIVPHMRDETLVPPDKVRFPLIPANGYGGVQRPAAHWVGDVNPLHVLNFGPQYKPGETGGVITREPPHQNEGSYTMLVPQVDADGNDIGGVRSIYTLVPIGTYTAWNHFRADWFDGGFCNFTGSFLPFAPTKAERLATGDPRLSIEERYPDKAAYVASIRSAAATLVEQRMLLAEDRDRLVAEAERDGVRTGP
jgi:hypothetical protein